MSHADSLFALDKELNVPFCLFIAVICGALRICKLRNAYLVLSQKLEDKLPFQKPTSVSEVIKRCFEEGPEAVN